MDAVYLCRSGSNEELRMSLRSMKNYRNLDRVWIFGGKPGWVTNVEFVETPQDGNKHRNVNTALRTACEHPDVSDPFLLMNDDFYITGPVAEIPTYDLGPIRQVAAAYKRQGRHGDYVDGMYRTLVKLELLGIPDAISYEAHTPLIVHKQGMLAALNHGLYHRRSMYGNLNHIPSTTIRDVKINTFDAPTPTVPFLSTSDISYRWMRPHLQALFPNPSPYES